MCNGGYSGYNGYSEYSGYSTVTQWIQWSENQVQDMESRCDQWGWSHNIQNELCMGQCIWSKAGIMYTLLDRLLGMRLRLLRVFSSMKSLNEQLSCFLSFRLASSSLLWVSSCEQLFMNHWHALLIELGWAGHGECAKYHFDRGWHMSSLTDSDMFTPSVTLPAEEALFFLWSSRLKLHGLQSIMWWGVGVLSVEARHVQFVGAWRLSLHTTQMLDWLYVLHNTQLLGWLSGRYVVHL